MDYKDLSSIFRSWTGCSSNFIGECFDHAKPFIEKDFNGIDPNVQFVSAQLFIDCHITSESTLILIRNGKEWDADLLVRSVMEGSLKYIYMLDGNLEEINEKIHEYWELLPMFSMIKHSERASQFLAEVENPDDPEWRPFHDLIIDQAEVDKIRREYSRAQRNEIQEKWSFSGISKWLLRSDNPGMRAFGCMAHGYGMSSHLLHKDADGVGIVWERSRRDLERRHAATLSHAARIVSDVCAFSKLRLLYLLKLVGHEKGFIDVLEKKYDKLFAELKQAYSQFSQIEYGIQDDVFGSNMK